MNARFLIRLALGCATLTLAAHAADVPRWSVHEIALTAAGEFQSAYTEVEVTAQFTGPDGTVKTVRGFWDGGRDFKVRFTPTMPGSWTYAVISKPADAGLARGGEFTCTAPAPNSHGFLRRDAEFPTSFVFDDGTRHFHCGTTYYALLFNARAGGDWQTSLTNIARYGVNKVRLHLDPSSDNTSKTRFPPSKPALDGDPDRPDIAHWQAADRVLRFMAERGMMAEIIVFPYRRAPKDVASLAQDERYLRYVLARFAAFPNVQWCLVNEWNYSVLPRDYWNAMGRLARAEDPWSVEGERPRALSIHQQTRPDWNFADETWPSHAIIQLGVRNRGASAKIGNEWAPAPDGVKRFTFGDDWGNHSIVRNWTGKQPVVNDEYGYIGEPQDDSAGAKRDGPGVRFTREKHRRTMWGIAAGGGYLATGDKNDYADDRPYVSATWHDVPEYGDLQHLVNFFTMRGLEYWKMAPHNEMAHGSRVYALAEPGRQYVVYAAAGGEFTLELAPGTYSATRFDPRTGEGTDLPAVHGGAQKFIMPDAQDWGVRLQMSPLIKKP